RLTCGDAAVEMAAARTWCAWEDEIMTLLPASPSVTDEQPLLALARIETHYFVNGAFLEEGQLISNAHRLGDIAGVIVQGRHDAVTPLITAWDLREAWPQAEFHIVPEAGHASSEPGILRRLVAATDAFAR
ncbi:MAG: prolyl aminopeptidase, partial [Burkholderiales bacterium]